MHRPVVISRQLAACEAMGPALSILKGIHNGKKECIPAAASLMAYQWLEQKLLLPELLIPLPFSIWQKQRYGFDVNLLLARELGKVFGVPVVDALKGKFDWPRFLSKGEFGSAIVADEQKARILCDQRILLVAPQMEDSLFRRAGEELASFFPAEIDALAFAAY